MDYTALCHHLNAAKEMLGLQRVDLISCVDGTLNVLIPQLLSVSGEPWLHLNKPVYSPDILYVGLMSQMPLRADFAPRHCICILDEPLPASYAREALRTNLVLVEMGSTNVDLMRLLNHVIFVLADDIRYLRGFNRLMLAQEEQYDTTKVLRLVEELLQNPVLLINSDRVVLAKGPQFQFADSRLQKDIADGRIQKSTLESIHFSNIQQLKGVGVLAEMQFSGWKGGFVSTPIYNQGIETAMLILQNNVSPYYESSIHLLDTIAHLLSDSLARQMVAQNDRALLHSLLFQELLSGNPTHELHQKISNLHWRQVPGMRLLCCCSTDASSVDAVLPLMQELFPDCRWTYVGNKLLLLLYPDTLEVRELPAIESLLKQYHLRGGLSWPFEQLELMPYAYQQAEAVLVYSSKILASYSFVFPSHIMTVPVESLRQMVHPAILLLEAYDQSHESNMLSTLEAVLFNTEQMHEVAERLYVHRNTLFYRLNRIRDLCDVDLSNGEERLNLLLSIRLLQGHGLLRAASDGRE